MKITQYELGLPVASLKMSTKVPRQDGDDRLSFESISTLDYINSFF